MISGLPTDAQGTLFHAGTTEKDGLVVTSGGRVIAATQLGETMNEALQKSFAQIEKVSFEGMYYRTDIGFDL